jgi:tetratricopeptide (TPR) repeat protein
MARDLQSPAEEARALEFMGALQMLKGNFTDAKKHYNEALLICEKINEPHRKADVKLKMGILYKYEGRIKDAVAALKEALKIYKKLKSYKASTTLEKINEFKKLA